MWIEGVQKKIKPVNVNEELEKLEGELDEETAKITLTDFLRYNLKLATYWLMGFRLVPYQVLIVKAWFAKNFCLNVFGRGTGKSTLAGIFAVLYCIFNPGTTVLIVSSNFRSSRRILEAIEKMATAPRQEGNPGGQLLRECFDGDLSRRNDLYQWEMFNQSKVVCVPLSNGEGLRGLRANVLIIDEALLVPKQIITQILIPFLVASADIGDKLRVRDIEDRLIAKGLMKEEERSEFPATSKLILLSSASYKWQYLYELYTDYIKKIAEGADLPQSYFVAQLSYKMVPDEILDEAILNEATGGTTSQSIVKMEYEAQFQDGSDGYFSAKKMDACTVPIGQEPCVELVGEKGAEYILAIDPSFSSSDCSDHFAMSVLKIIKNRDGKKMGMLVHSYALSGVELKDHIQYLAFILENFNIVWIACDTTQGDNFDFINTANESAIFKERKLHLNAIEANFNQEDYGAIIQEVHKSYSLTNKRIAQKQSFTSAFQRAANEYLQACYDCKGIWFAGEAKSIENKISEYSGLKLDILDKHSYFRSQEEKGSKIYDFIEWQDSLINLTKKECVLIEVSTSAQGNQSFDLPQSMRRNKTNPKRPRKDNYSSLLLANWALRIYLEATSMPVEEENTTFEPMLL